MQKEYPDDVRIFEDGPNCAGILLVKLDRKRTGVAIERSDAMV